MSRLKPQSPSIPIFENSDPPRRGARFAPWLVSAALLVVPGLTPTHPASAQEPSARQNKALGLGGAWTPQGPSPILDDLQHVDPDNSVEGAIHALAPHPVFPNVLYVGAVNGGVWVTNNATDPKPHWIRLTDDQVSQSIGALEFDPTDSTHRTLVAGPGSYSAYGDGGDLAGILRTTDGGASWKQLTGGGVMLDKSISGIAARGETIVASVDVAPIFDFPYIGIFRSKDGGKSFKQISRGAGKATGLPLGQCHDLAGDPLRPKRLFTSVVFADLAGGRNGLYRSDDTGANWTKVSSPAVDSYLISGRTNNVEFAVGRHNEVYVAIVNRFVLAAVFRSGDGGNTWTQMDLPTTIEDGVPIGIHPGGQGDFHMSLVADPTNAFTVYIGGDRQPAFNEADDNATRAIFPNSIGATGFWGRLFRGNARRAPGNQWVHITARNDKGAPGGGTASNSGPHVDSREMAFDAAGNLLEGDDGGIYKRSLPRSNQGDWFSLNGDLQTTEIHDLALDRTSNILFAGTQDNDSIYQNRPGSLDWTLLIYGDGGDVNVDDRAADESVRFTSRNFLRTFNRAFWDNEGGFVDFEILPLEVLGDGDPIRSQFYTPVRNSAGNPQHLVIGAANGVYESLDAGDTVTEIGAGIRVNSIGFKPLAYGSESNPNALYLGGSDDPDAFPSNKVWVRTGAQPAPLVRSVSYPGTRAIRSIAIDPRNGDQAFVVDSGNVFRTTDAGVTWSNVSGNLGTFNASVLRSVTFAHTAYGNAVIVGSNRGVYISTARTGFTKWRQLGSALPTVPVFDLRYDARGDQLTAGTLGRGAFLLNGVSLAVLQAD